MAARKKLLRRVEPKKKPLSIAVTDEQRELTGDIPQLLPRRNTDQARITKWSK